VRSFRTLHERWLPSFIFSPSGRDKREGAGCGNPFFRTLPGDALAVGLDAHNRAPRRVHHLDEAILPIKAIASGNPTVMEKVRIDTELRKLDQLRAVHLNQQHNIRWQLRHLPEKLTPGKPSSIPTRISLWRCA